MTLKPVRIFSDRGFAADGSRTLPALDGGAPIFVPAPVGPPPPPPPGGTLFGSSITPQTAARYTQLNNELNITGYPVARIYDSGPALPGSWSNGAGGFVPSLVTDIVISFKFDTSAMGAGNLDGAFNAILNSAPTNRNIWWCIGEHEPDAKINKGNFTLAAWQASAKRMANLVAAKNVAKWKRVIITTDQAFETGHGYSAPDFYMGGGYAELWTIDKFNPNSNPDTNPAYKPLSTLIAPGVNYLTSHNIPWGVTETNAYEATDRTKKANWITQMGDFCASNGATLVTYWDDVFGSDPNPQARKLDSSQTSLNAFHNVCVKYNP